MVKNKMSRFFMVHCVVMVLHYRQIMITIIIIIVIIMFSGYICPIELTRHQSHV